MHQTHAAERNRFFCRVVVGKTPSAPSYVSTRWIRCVRRLFRAKCRCCISVYTTVYWYTQPNTATDGAVDAVPAKRVSRLLELAFRPVVRDNTDDPYEDLIHFVNTDITLDADTTAALVTAHPRNAHAHAVNYTYAHKDKQPALLGTLGIASFSVVS